MWRKEEKRRGGEAEENLLEVEKKLLGGREIGRGSQGEKTKGRRGREKTWCDETKEKKKGRLWRKGGNGGTRGMV